MPFVQVSIRFVVGTPALGFHFSFSESSRRLSAVGLLNICASVQSPLGVVYLVFDKFVTFSKNHKTICSWITIKNIEPCLKGDWNGI